MRVKNVNVSFKTGPEDGLEDGQFMVYPSTFIRQRDAYGDVIAKGAFLDSIKAWEESGDVMPAMYRHDPDQIVGGALEMGEDDHGWWVKGFFDDDPAAQRVYNLVKTRRLTSLSFAFDVLDEGSVELADGRKANELRKLNVHEFSFLPKGYAANSDTSVVAVKADKDSQDQRFTATEVAALKELVASKFASEEEEVAGKPDSGDAALRVKERINALIGAETEDSK